MKTARHYFSQRMVAILVTLGVVVGFAGGAIAADARLDQADANLEKAYALIEAAKGVTGEFNEKDLRTYERILGKAQSDIDRANGHVADAIAFADSTP